MQANFSRLESAKWTKAHRRAHLYVSLSFDITFRNSLACWKLGHTCGITGAATPPHPLQSGKVARFTILPCHNITVIRAASTKSKGKAAERTGGTAGSEACTHHRIALAVTGGIGDEEPFPSHWAEVQCVYSVPVDLIYSRFVIYIFCPWIFNMITVLLTFSYFA